jgi:glycosyl transferase family 2
VGDRITYVGLDVHKEGIVVTVAEGGIGGDDREYGRIPNTAGALDRLMRKFGGAGVRLRFCLGKSLDSILNQTFTDFELIISDNASTDRTGEIAKAYAKRNHRIRYYRSEKNMGPGWNIRRVYELATAKYFKWAAADDVLESEFLRRCVEILEGAITTV